MASCIMRSSVPPFSDFRLIEELMSNSNNNIDSADYWAVMGSSSSSSVYPERFGVASGEQQMVSRTSPSPSGFASMDVVTTTSNNDGSSRMKMNTTSGLPLMVPCKVEPDEMVAAASPSSSSFKHLLMSKDSEQVVHHHHHHHEQAAGKRHFVEVDERDDEQQQQQQHQLMLGISHRQQQQQQQPQQVDEGPVCSSPSKAGAQHAGEADHEVHIWTERERRKKMRSMFVTLQSMLPKVPSKADKSTIVDEAISYIKLLEQKMQKLIKRKAERVKPSSSRFGYDNGLVVVPSGVVVDHQTPQRPNDCFHTLSSSKVVLNVCGSEAFINVCTTSRPNLLSNIFGCLIGLHKLEVKNVQISDTNDRNRRLFTIHVCSRDFSRGSEELKAVIRDLMQFV